MALTLTLDGLAAVDSETRSIAHVTADYDGNIYKWSVYVPDAVVNLSNFLSLALITNRVKNQIDAAEAEWAALDPKTRTIINELGEEVIVPILKEEVVRPTIPDYYTRRRLGYPPLGEQLDAIWKGLANPSDQDYLDMAAKIAAIKTRFPAG